MEANAQYALHDSEAAPPAWAARVRLTPELLQKLRQDPQQVLLKLNVASGDGAPKARGAIHQKLLVQRLLDATEKDRIKDKHAKSVLASKSRASKLIDSNLEKPSKSSDSRDCRVYQLRGRLAVEVHALTEEGAKEARETIESRVEVEVEAAPAASREEEKITVKETAAAARDADFHALFSSDSDDEEHGVRRSQVLRREKKKTTIEVKELCNSTTATGVDNEQSESKSVAGAKNEGSLGSDSDATAQPKETTNAATGNGVNDELAKNESSTTEAKQSEERLDIYALKPIKPSTRGVEVKRARVRSALVSDRVKQARLPDLSFFPSAVVQICQRLANYHGRSIILDESDYDSFVETHEQFRQDWEMLDKAYSIEMIKTEGLHLQLEVASSDSNCEQLRQRIKASSSKKEGLLFVRDAMASIQKILHSIQVSVDRFDTKSHTSQTTSDTQY
ncbi:hypothetical protein GN244_ATG12732 [Phytophthora infestans]|uniref:Uncharacterized protein n=1 Tax=Phytophthora infestans TaxID=4787 RepID=A0A833SZ89_PHYIN|nr:hypothetical protein GN244_ATG12732 [Phytophthora infestans]